MTVHPGGAEDNASWAAGDREQEQLPFSALLEDSAEDLYENAPCGYLSTLLDGRIAKVNQTLLTWLGYRRDELVGHKRFSDLLTVGGRLYHETHFSPLLRIQGVISGIALELKAADGSRLPVMVTSVLKRDSEGEPLLIRTTLLDAQDRRTYERELLRSRREAEHDRERLQRLATTLQRTLIPPALQPVPGLDVAAHYHFASSDEVGGDFYDLFPLAAGRWAFFMGDVRGKGADAAVVTSLARYTLRAAAVSDPVPATVLANLNTALCQASQDDEPRFCTVIFGLLTPRAEGGGFHIVLAGGGHPAAVLLRADGSADYVPTPGGQLVGVVPDAEFTTVTVDLGPGDTLLLYTDGLTEAHAPRTGERFGDEALLDVARDLAPVSASGAVEALTVLLDGFGEGLDDDTALLAMGVASRSPRLG
ncbi:PP2C family protein-serine/threonine phosphatase [Streptomyces sp. HB132]|uniref:PP2C family protein-serine/threonine phosphatase n=1 Tax=Streptomyces sp. HB132 TaxID=767388 RepID=UPI0019620ED0|nr:SpoIIE family protein phosphatase [Streptomyces sp. HB132]MBM7439695.1 sigma-B regulation protein RsbU (phosphoserine phosphatase) [Streptomyces sp. HB132]